VDDPYGGAVAIGSASPVLKEATIMKPVRIILIFVLVLSQYGCATESEETVKRPGQPYVVIQGGLLIDGTGRAPIPDSVVVIEGGTIKAVGPLGQVTIPAMAQTINAKNKFVLPGLIDMHVHYKDWEDQLFISHGVTTVRDVGGNLDYILQARKRSHDEGVKKPRIFSCGPMLDGSPPFFGIEVSAPAATPQEAKSAASKLISSKVDCLKIQQKITVPLLEAITEVAKKEKMPVTAHLGDSRLGNIKAQAAILLGIKGLEHMSGIDFLNTSQSELAEIADMIVSHAVFVDATLVLDDTLSRLLDPELKKDPLLKQVPPKEFIWWERYYGLNSWWTERHSNRWRAILRKKKEFIRMLVKKGGVITAGTDTPIPYVYPGVSLHQELELLVSAGLTPMQAIMAATKNAAELLGHTDQLGTLEAGKIADLQILSANPLENIANARSVEMVFRDGKLIWKK
jgi:imidazolonepropionase-like amidohydrolase